MMMFFKIFSIIILFTNLLFAQQISDFSKKIDIYNINSLSFNALDFDNKFLSEEEYSNFIKDHIFSQPEFKYALASQNEKRLLLRSANRERFPTLSGRVINDEVIDRKIDDLSSLRKRQDDSFDAVAEIRQPLFEGGKINSQIKYARYEYNNSSIQKNSTTCSLILESNQIFVSAMVYNHLYKYASELLNNLLPLKDKMKTRVESGAADPVQYAVFLARLNKFQSTIYNLEAQAKTSLANYENTFNQVFIFQGFPKIPIIVNNDYSNKNSFELSIKENIYLSSLENVKITRSDYLPKLGISARYTEYDIDQSTDESDIRGGIYLNFPIFDFGRGRAKIQAARAKSDASKLDIEVERKLDDVVENEIITIIESSNKAIQKLKDAFLDTKKQRELINDRILLTGFSPLNLVDASENELIQLQNLLETEARLLSSFYNFLHHNQALLAHFKLSL